MIEMLQWMAKYLLFVFATLGVYKLKPIFSLLVSAQKTFIECVFLVAGLFGTWKTYKCKECYPTSFSYVLSMKENQLDVS